ncbi:MAG: hypothetical protein U0T69_10870 [Chitinophagales bacterium]
MMNNQFIVVIFLIIFFTSCVSEEAKKKEAVARITNNLCDHISELLATDNTDTPNDPNDELVLALVDLFHIPLEKCCSCVMENIEDELQTKFSFEELMEIQEDQVKQLMVARKIIENNPTQEKIVQCIENKMLGKYEDFNKKLEDKFKNNEE